MGDMIRTKDVTALRRHRHVIQVANAQLMRIICDFPSQSANVRVADEKAAVRVRWNIAALAFDATSSLQ